MRGWGEEDDIATTETEAAPLHVERCVEPDASAVDAYVEAHPQAAAYHRPAFARVLRRGAGLLVETFVARRLDGSIAGVLPVALTQSRLFGHYATSLPHFNYAGVLATDPDAGPALVRAAWAWASARGARHMVLRHTTDRPLDLPCTTGKETCTLELPRGGPDALWSKIGSKPRNLIRKAERAGLEAAPEGPAGLAAFHAVYAENMRDLGTPSLGCGFFRVLLDQLGPDAEVHVVRRGRRPVAGAVCIRFRDRYEVPWAGSLRRYRDAAANMLLYWEMLRHAARAGVRTFDFGRSTPGSGPYKFKLQWGAQPEPLPWYFIGPPGRVPTGELAPTNPKYAAAIWVWKRLPVGIARTIGAHLAPKLP